MFQIGILGGFFTGVANVINSIASKIPSFNADTSHLGESVSYMNNLLAKVNVIFPVDTIGTVLGLILGIFICLIAFYFIQRLINIVRGAG